MIPAFHLDAFNRAREYSRARELTLKTELGSGYDGIVIATTAASAVKAFRYEVQFTNERNVYQRLREYRAEEIAGFSVPNLINHDNKLMIVEMSIVSPPFVLDFAGAYLDRDPPFSRREMLATENKRRREFGKDWPRVQQLLRDFRKMGIQLADVSHSNIALGRSAKPT